MKYLTSLAALCCLSAALVGCQNNDTAMSSVSPAALGEESCCADGVPCDGCSGKAAPGAMSDEVCPYSGAAKEAAPGAMKDASDCSACPSSSGASMGAMSETASDCGPCPASSGCSSN